jgi:hypothetical protein
LSNYQLAQMNIARLLAPLDSPQLADFVANLDRINALAEGSPGFVWRLQTDDGDATSLRPLGDDTIVNMSVWIDLDALSNYVYRSDHVEVLRRRREWFQRMVEAYVVLWWVPKGHTPTVEEGIERLDHLRQHGPTAHAFNVRKPFSPPDDAGEAKVPPTWADCPA